MRRAVPLLSAGLLVIGAIVGALSCSNRDPLDGINSTKLQTVTSQAGQIEFQIPETWKSEPEDTFMQYYFPDPEAGTLRLTVSNFKRGGKEDKYRPGVFVEAFKQEYKATSSPEPHPNGGQIIRFEKKGFEGVPIFLTFWEWECKVGGYVVLSNFSYTLKESQRNDPVHQATIALLDRQIRAAKIRQ